ncbi:gp48 [Rhodococcus phage ReqiPine5]|uniref:Gp48 n=1 Tax=Rhodococcus phage ReqiPine5 TaxID=691963 RepID=D4P823_9CAUD|nr:gp48 [Rhodococcus phage ReqiPine5]ADD81153.1 gp48 [Rhodococcus phage ReqiPine5]
MGAPKLTPDQVRTIVAEHVHAAATPPELAAKYGVQLMQIHRILKGQSWVQVTGGENVYRNDQTPIVTDAELIRLRRRGLTQQAIADRHMISQAAVSKRLRRLHSKGRVLA